MVYWLGHSSMIEPKMHMLEFKPIRRKFQEVRNMGLGRKGACDKNDKSSLTHSKSLN